MSSTPESDKFDDWYSDTHGGTGEPEVEKEEEIPYYESFDDPWPR